jgi:glutamine synthetase
LPYKITNGKIEQLRYSVDDVMHKLYEDKIKFLDLQFTGLMGSFHHTTIAANMLRKENFEDGLPKLDGSSIRGLTLNKRVSIKPI